MFRIAHSDKEGEGAWRVNSDDDLILANVQSILTEIAEAGLVIIIQAFKHAPINASSMFIAIALSAQGFPSKPECVNSQEQVHFKRILEEASLLGIETRTTKQNVNPLYINPIQKLKGQLTHASPVAVQKMKGA